MTIKNSPLIFTDLDGTLLDHDTYEWQSAQPALALAYEHAVPVIPCTSKTLPECVTLQRAIGIRGPLIFENGAGAALPKAEFSRPKQHLHLELEHHWVCGFGANYTTIKEKLENIKRYGRYVFKGFSVMTDEEVAKATNLPLERAAQAKKRLHSEPITWMDTAKSFNHFHKDIREAGLSLVRGGRFIHVLENVDKGQTMHWLAKRYYPAAKKLPYLIALGDSPNDIPMLQAANTAVIVKNPSRGALEYSASKDQTLIRTKKPGPQGWNEAVISILSKESAHG